MNAAVITMPSNKSLDLEAYLKEVASVLRENLDADSKRHLMDQELLDVGDKLEEIIVVINEALALYDYDPTPQYLYDNDGGEPPLSADERWQAAFNEKMEAKG